MEELKTPTPSKAAENQKEKGKSGIITDLFNTKGGEKGDKKEHKACGSIRSKWQIPTHQYQ